MDAVSATIVQNAVIAEVGGDGGEVAVLQMESGSATMEGRCQ